MVLFSVWAAFAATTGFWALLAANLSCLAAALVVMQVGTRAGWSPWAAAGVVGVDLNPHFAAASAFGPALVGDLRALPFADASFDGVWACAALVHLPEADAVGAMAELARVAKPGALVAVSVKCAGTTGWTETAHGRRWSQIWDPGAFAAGLRVESVQAGPVFVDVWAHA